jgi:hypothetical protein
MNTKKCTKCDKVKSLDEFYWRNDSKRYTSWCKQCIIKKQGEYQKKFFENNPDKYEKHLAYEKIYYRNNKDKWIFYYKKWINNNPIRFAEICKNKDIKRYSILKNKISKYISVTIRRYLKGNKQGKHWEDIVGYTLEQLINHLESLFQEGMTWDNYGYRGWHIDHIIPISLWKFSSYEDREFKQCWALCNLQPLWGIDNMKKSDKWVA